MKRLLSNIWIVTIGGTVIAGIVLFFLLPNNKLIEQNHYGSGDNIDGNKNFYTYNNIINPIPDYTFENEDALNVYEVIEKYKSYKISYERNQYQSSIGNIRLKGHGYIRDFSEGSAAKIGALNFTSSSTVTISKDSDSADMIKCDIDENTFKKVLISGYGKQIKFSGSWNAFWSGLGFGFGFFSLGECRIYFE